MQPFSTKCNIYISRLYYNVSVRLSVTEVHWHIIANLGFKFRSKLSRIVVAGRCNLNNNILHYASHWWALLFPMATWHFQSTEQHTDGASRFVMSDLLDVIT